MIFLAYPPAVKNAYKVWRRSTNRLIVRRDVFFDELVLDNDVRYIKIVETNSGPPTRSESFYSQGYTGAVLKTSTQRRLERFSKQLYELQQLLKSELTTSGTTSHTTTPQRGTIIKTVPCVVVNADYRKPKQSRSANTKTSTTTSNESRKTRKKNKQGRPQTFLKKHSRGRARSKKKTYKRSNRRNRYKTRYNNARPVSPELEYNSSSDDNPTVCALRSALLIHLVLRTYNRNHPCDPQMHRCIHKHQIQIP